MSTDINMVLIELSMIEQLIAGDVSLKNEEEDNIRISEKVRRVRQKIENAHKGLVELLELTSEEQVKSKINSLIQMLEAPLKPITIKD